MPHQQEATLPAARLRKNDVLVGHRDGATIARPPVISTDGSMVTVIVSTTPHTATHLLRIPVDQPVRIQRPRNDAQAFIRKKRTAKSSGSQILILDLAHPDSDIEAHDGERFATLCVPHQVLQFHTHVSTADAISSHPEEWCAACAQSVQDRARQRIYGDSERKRA